MMTAMQMRAAARRKPPINTRQARVAQQAPAPAPAPAPEKPKPAPVPLPPGPEIKEPEPVDTIVVEAAPDAKIVVEMGGDGTNLAKEEDIPKPIIRQPRSPKDNKNKNKE